MNILISGGAKNGKTEMAVRLCRRMAAETGAPLYYVATMIPADEEDRNRIRAHVRARAGLGFRTLEQGKGILSLLRRDDVDPAGVFLLDSTTALLANEMFPAPAGEKSVTGTESQGTEPGAEPAADCNADPAPESWYDPSAAMRVPEMLASFAGRTGNTVFVSDGIYSDARIPAAVACGGSAAGGPDLPDLTEVYRRALAAADRKLAAACGVVLEAAAGNAKIWKGGPEAREWLAGGGSAAFLSRGGNRPRETRTGEAERSGT